VIGIRKEEGVAVIEHGGSFFEAESVLSKIAATLGRVPLDLQIGHDCMILTLYLQCKALMASLMPAACRC
jgi:hypothetical protein